MSNAELYMDRAKLERAIAALNLKAEATAPAIRRLLSQLCITVPIEEADLEQAASLLADLIEIKGEKIRNMGTIKKIEREIA